MNPTLILSDINKTYKNSKDGFSLKNVCIQIETGEVFGFVGQNGAGKSTTIKIILNLINDYTGTVHIHGINAKQADARSALAYVAESPALYENFTPLEIIMMGLEIYKRKHISNTRWALNWLSRFSIEHVAHKKIRQLSKGTAQRVALAQALAVQPKLLILDEPLSGLDPAGRKDVIDILAEYKSNGGSIFFTSHVLHDVERIADRFGFIHKGELLTVRSPRDLANERADNFTIRYQSTEPISDKCLQIRNGEFESEIKQIDIPNFSSQLNAANARLITVKPSVSLESLFFKILEEQRK